MSENENEQKARGLIRDATRRAPDRMPLPPGVERISEEEARAAGLPAAVPFLRRHPGRTRQADPTGEGEAIWPILIAETIGVSASTWDDERSGLLALIASDMEDRDAHGRATYGTPLRLHNGRDAMVDSYQEILDAWVYCRLERAQTDSKREDSELLRAEDNLREAAIIVRGELERRGWSR